jgi:integrase
MPRRSKGPHLWFRPARRDASGRLTHSESYVIIDASRQISTGSATIEVAEAQLAKYITEKYTQTTATVCRDIRHIPVADVIAVYARDVAPTTSRPHATGLRLGRLLEFFDSKTLADVNGGLCRRFAAASSTDANARRDLQDFAAAINHHQREGLHNQIVRVVMPPARPPRERFLDRSEAARLLWALWRRPRCGQIAKFMLIALYTGRRASVVCNAAFSREPGCPWVDLSKGYLWPPERVIQTKKRNPPIPLPPKLLTHLRAWKRSGHRYVVPWGDHSVSRVDRTMKLVAESIGLGHVTPHVLRHTAATWQMQAGTDMLEAGRYLGMTTRTLESTYAHHRPEHLTGARDAYQRMTRER